MKNIKKPETVLKINRGWWEQHHKNKNKKWLTGTSLNYIKNCSDIKPKGTILVVGVGLGNDSRELIKEGNIVDALDVSNIALTKASFRNTFIFPEKQPPENTYDYIIMFLVAQHVNDEVLDIELGQLIKSLKPEGVLLLQYYENDIKYHGELAEQHGGVSRSKQEMEDIVHKNKGIVCKYINIEEHKWGVMHIVRNT